MCCIAQYPVRWTAKTKNAPKHFALHRLFLIISPVRSDRRGIRHRVLTNQRDRSYVYAVVSLAAGGPFA